MATLGCMCQVTIPAPIFESLAVHNLVPPKKILRMTSEWPQNDQFRVKGNNNFGVHRLWTPITNCVFLVSKCSHLTDIGQPGWMKQGIWDPQMPWNYLLVNLDAVTT